MAELNCQAVSLLINAQFVECVDLGAFKYRLDNRKTKTLVFQVVRAGISASENRGNDIPGTSAENNR